MEATAGLKPGADTVLDAETLEALAGDIPTAELSRDEVARRTSPHDSHQLLTSMNMKSRFDLRVSPATQSEQVRACGTGGKTLDVGG